MEICNCDCINHESQSITDNADWSFDQGQQYSGEQQNPSADGGGSQTSGIDSVSFDYIAAIDAEASSDDTAADDVQASSADTAADDVKASSGATAADDVEASSEDTAADDVQASSDDTADDVEASSEDTAADDVEASSEATGVNDVQASSDATVVNESIVVKAGETFDGENQTFTAGSALGDGGQDEGQDPIFILEEGATLKNVVIGDNGADGVHVYGDATVDNVHWTDVGEDALTVKESGDDGIADVQVTNSSAQDANDKIFQVNADANVTIDGFEATNFGQLLVTNGSQQGNFEVNLNDITAKNSEVYLVKSEAEGIVVNADNISTENVSELWSLPDSATLNETNVTES